MAVIDSLVAYWSLEESSGSAVDAHASNDLTDNNTVGTTTGKVSDARLFVAANGEFFSLADNADLSVGNIDASWNLWGYLAGTGSTGVIMAKWSSGDYEFNLYYDHSVARFKALVYDGTSFATATATTFGAPSSATWYMLTILHDATADTIGIAVNNGAIDTAAIANGIRDGSAVFRMGNDNNGTGYWDGRLDEVGFWKKKLSAAEITWLYNSGNGRSYADIVAEGSSTVIPVFMNQYRQRWR